MADCARYVASITFTILTFFKIREIVINAIPHNLKLAMAAGIGMFIAFIGLQGGGLVVASKSSLVQLGSLTVPDDLADDFWIVRVTALLMARKVPGDHSYRGIVATAILGLVTGLIKAPSQIVSSIPSMKPTFAVGIKHLGDVNTPQMWAAVLIFLLVAFFDTAGTLIGLRPTGGINENDKMPRIGQAFDGRFRPQCLPVQSWERRQRPLTLNPQPELLLEDVRALLHWSLLFCLALACSSPLLSVVTTQVTTAPH